MRFIFTFITAAVCLTALKAQENYRDFENIKKAVFAEWSGVIDSANVNTFTNAINSSTACGKYIRDTALYDNFKLFPLNPLVNVTPYADTAVAAPRITMKIRTSAPPGTIVKIQLGTRTSTAFPAGVHSEYTATTTVSNAWELLTFNYWMSPVGGYTTATEIDKIVIFFRPNSTVKDTVYFDDPTGPELIVTHVGKNKRAVPFKLYQNIPNPAAGITKFKFDLDQNGNVEMKLTDMLGRKIADIISQEMKKGTNEAVFDSSGLEDGVYYYTIRMKGYSETKRMVISR